MPTDDIVLNPGSAGATARALADSSNREWFPGVCTYATTVSAGANVLQVVTPSFPLPVTGTLTVNAGTNLNTSALALEAGHLATIDSKTPALGQALAAASVPVVLTAAQIATLTPLTTVAVTGTFWQATQPVSAASLPLPSGASTAAKQPAIGTAGTAATDVITVQGIASGTPLTVTASAGTNLNTSALALDATLTGGTQKTKLVDSGGTNAATISAGGAVKVDGSAATQPVSGTFWQTTQPVSGTFWQTTQPVSGTVTANMGTTNGLIVAQGSTTSGQSGPLMQGAVTTSAPTYTTGQTAPASFQTDGSLRSAITNTVAMSQSGTFTVTQGDPSATTGNITTVDLVVSSASGQGSQSILTGTPTAASFLTATLSAHTSVGIQVTGTWTGTLSFERSMDGGTTYVPMSAFLHGVSGASLSSITGNCFLYANVGACTNIRVRATAAITGTAAVKLLPSFGGELVAAALQGGSNVIGQVAASGETGTIFSGTTALTPLYKSFTITNSSGAAASTVVALTSGKIIRILSYRISFNSTVNTNWQSHTTTATASGLTYGIQYLGSGRTFSPVGHFQAIVSEALDLNLSGNGTVSGELEYILVS